VVSTTPRPLYPRERPGTHWVGLRAGLDVCEKPRHHRDSIPGPSSPKSVSIPTELPGSHLYVGITDKTIKLEHKNAIKDIRLFKSSWSVFKNSGKCNEEVNRI
jgi:hypothetical protein